MTSATTLFTATTAATTGPPVFIQRTSGQLTVDLNAATVDGADFTATDLDAPVGNGGRLAFLPDSFRLPDLP